MKTALWTHDEAVELIRQVEPMFARVNIHTVITGSVLYKGDSTKDLDVILYPHDGGKLNKEAAVFAARTIGFDEIAPRCQFVGEGLFGDSGDDMRVWKASWQGKRVDFFLLD